MLRHHLKFRAYALRNETADYPLGGFKGAFLETYGKFDIAWFEWDRDGIIPEAIIPDDWEPVVLHWDDGDLVGVSVRRHFQWKDFYSARLAPGDSNRSIFSEPLEIVFQGSNHAANVHNPTDLMFESIRDLHVQLQYDYRPIARSEVPSYAVKPHISIRRGIFLNVGESIYERAASFSY